MRDTEGEGVVVYVEPDVTKQIDSPGGEKKPMIQEKYFSSNFH